MTCEELLQQALPGLDATVDLSKKPWTSLGDRPWKVWDSNGKRWAVYQVIGNGVGETQIDALKAARKNGIETILVAKGHEEISAISGRFLEVRASILCDIAGKAHIIRRGTVPKVSSANAPKIPSARIPLELLTHLAPLVKKEAKLKLAFGSLLTSYKALHRRNTVSDAAEERILVGFGTEILKRIGFKGTEIDPAKMLRSLEKANWGGKRDHFFHSFQNYFFGLYAILALPKLFNAYDTLRRLNWDIDPFDVWFLTTLWHDVGYGIEKSGTVLGEVYGDEVGQELAETTRQQYLNNPTIKKGLDKIACLMAHLLSGKKAQAAWMIPDDEHRRTPTEMKLIRAIRSNLMASHGAASGLRMYYECMTKIGKMAHQRQLRPKQALLIACVSAPFHDWHFRKSIREELGKCLIPCDALPFACLLAFVDSIQDDRRDIASLQAEIAFLERVIITDGGKVSAEVNRSALAGESVLWKIIEARDVLASLEQKPDGLGFEYPAWMASA